MADMDAFERSVAKGLLRLADDVAGTVDAAAVAHRVALEHPRRRARALAWGPVSMPRLAWVLLVAGMLLALVAGSLVAGGWWRNLAVVVDASPAPTPAATVIADPADILATTKAKPLPAQATCPPGSTPDTPGAVDQDRPTGGEMAFDRHAGRIVLLAPDPLDPEGRASQTWTYDVCTNTWQLMRPAGGSPPGSWWPFFEPGKGRLIYDADSDRMLAFTDDHIWSYDLAPDRWADVGLIPDVSGGANETFGTTFYHDPSGLVVVYDGADMWAYDVDTNTTAKVRQIPDPSLPAGSGLPQGRIAFGYDPAHDLVVAVVVPYSISVDSAVVGSTAERGETWTFNPGNGTWRKETAPAARDLIVCGHLWKASTDCFGTNGRAVFDEASGLTVFFNRTGWTGSNRIDAYDAGQGAWRTLRGPAEVGPGTPSNCQSAPPVYDPLNRRIVCLAVSEVSAEYWGGGIVGAWAFSTATGQSHWLLEPHSSLRCDVSTIAGTPGEAGAVDGTGAAARFSEPHSIVVDEFASVADEIGKVVFVADTGNHAIRQMTPSGTVTTFAGAPGEPGFVNGPGAAARFDRPSGIAVLFPQTGGRYDYSTLYVADTGNDAIRKIASDGTVTTIAKGLGISPVGIAVDGNRNVYTGGLTGNVILKITPDGSVTTFAGKWGEPGWVDAEGSAARLGAVIDMKLTSPGQLTVIDMSSDGSDSALRTVRLVDAMVKTSPIDWAAYGRPGATDGSGTVVSTLDHTVTRVDGTAVAVLAGMRGEVGYQDGRNDGARFQSPTGIAQYPGPGYVILFIADSGNSVIRTMACTP